MGSPADWLDNRTNFRAGLARLLDEPLPPGTGWWFVTGSVLLFLLALQFLTGVVLAMYYVPAPEFAYDSVRFISSRLSWGRVLRGLHFFGASFIVVAAVVHMLRVVAFGSYKKPREVTWITGVLLLLIILAFALSGYLLPWDQRAYWATTVTINIARGTPLVGEPVAALLRGGPGLGALTLLRWYAAHVFLLPAALAAFTVSHVYLMRRHGISGPVTPAPGEAKAFYPYHALKDTIVVAVVFAAVLALAVAVRAPLDAVADPTDAAYVPRPEWYFLSLFQLLKYFPGRLEPVATMVIPGAVVTALLLLPFLDRGGERRPLRRPLVTSAFGLGLVCVGALTWLGFRDTPRASDPRAWTPLALAGYEFSQDRRCTACHRVGGPGDPLDRTIARKDPEWLTGHVRDPQVIAPGLRPVPAGGMNESQASAVLAYMRRVRAGAGAPAPSPGARSAALVYRPVLRDLPRDRWRGGRAGAGPQPRRRDARRDMAAELDRRSHRHHTRRQHAGVRRPARRCGDGRDRRVSGRAEIDTYMAPGLAGVHFGGIVHRFVSLTTVLAVTWALSAALIAQKTITAEDLDRLMKKDGPAQQALVRALSAGNQAVAKTQLAQLKAALTETQQFWITNKRPDAVQFNKTVLATIDELDRIVAAPQMDATAALSTVRDLAAACNACHKVYRATDEDGSFTLKPGSVPGL